MEFYEIGKKIRELRKEKKITQERLSKEVGISRQTLSKLENGKIHKISLQLFTKLLDELDCELEIMARKPFYYFDIGEI